VTYKSSI